MQIANNMTTPFSHRQLSSWGRPSFTVHHVCIFEAWLPLSHRRLLTPPETSNHNRKKWSILEVVMLTLIARGKHVLPLMAFHCASDESHQYSTDKMPACPCGSFQWTRRSLLLWPTSCCHKLLLWKQFPSWCKSNFSHAEKPNDEIIAKLEYDLTQSLVLYHDWPVRSHQMCSHCT